MQRDEAEKTRPLGGRPGYRLVRTALRVRQRYADELAQLGLLPNQHAILSTLHELGPCHQKELAARVGLDPGDIVAYLDGLNADTYVERTRDPSDRRRQIVTLTEAGRRTLEAADIALDAMEEHTFACFTGKEADAFFGSLDKLSDTLSGEGGAQEIRPR